MTSASVPGQSAPPKGREPSYEFGRREADILARFPAGKRVPVVRGRERAYPGLRSSAPSTLPFYQAFVPHLVGKHVLDAGCGSSQGARILSESVPHVTAIDNDVRALTFAREYAPNIEFLQADLCLGTSVDRADAAFLIDVLGHLARPEAALRALRACLPVGSQLFVAEPKSYSSQRLIAPACRAFSPRALRQLLLRSGFDQEQSAWAGANFVALVARRSGAGDIEALVEGFHQTARADFSAARSEFARARRSERLEVRLEALLGEAESALAANDGDMAVRRLFEANELDDRDGRALSGLARVALATGEIDDALRLAMDALQRDPTDASANMAMALAAEQLARPDAFDAWRIAVNLAPDDLDLATGLARVSAARQNFAFAIRVFERLRSYCPTLGVDFHITLGWLLLADGRKNDASVEARYAFAVAPARDAVIELVHAIEAP